MKNNNLITIGMLLVISSLFGGCASVQKVEYSPMSEEGMEVCAEVSECFIETDKGKTSISIGNKSAVSISSQHVVDEHDNKYHDFLITIKNTSNEEIYFDPYRIPGYDEEALTAKLEGNQNLLLGLGLFAMFTGALSGSETSDIDNLSQMVSEGMENDQIKIDAKKEEFSNEKLESQTILPSKSASGRIVLKPSNYTGEYVYVSIPVDSDLHVFEFKKTEIIEEEI